jgi:hypothetical protein
MIADHTHLQTVDAWLLRRSAFELWALAAVLAAVFALAVILI